MIFGILITRISDNGETITGVHLETGKKRTVYYDKKYGGWNIKK